MLFALFGLHQMAVILINTAEDYPEDEADGLRTLPLARGIPTTMAFAWYTVLLAGLGMQVLMVLLFFNLNIALWMALPTLIFTAGWLVILKELKGVWKQTRGLSPKDAADKVLKKNGMKVPRWLNIGAYTTLAVVAIWSVLELLP